MNRRDNSPERLHYFQAPGNYFWRWADNGEVIEWMNQSTICYRDELVHILKTATSLNLPSLSTVLLVLAAGQENYQNAGGKGILSGILKNLPDVRQGPSAELVEHHLRGALRFLDTVSQLQKDFRKRENCIHILRVIFEEADILIGGLQLRDAVQDLNSGLTDKLILKPGPSVTREIFLRDIKALSEASLKFNDAPKLEFRLRTGLFSLPAPADFILPESAQLDILDQLAADPKTQGIARLTRRLIAAMNIPMHSINSSDQRFGGISDITNRGNYDKLLLSELAQDDEILTARLVNNESLYFRREQPPDSPQIQRTILLDITIKMWGLPRVFGFSAVLACSKNIRRGEMVETFALRGSSYENFRIDTKDQILQALELLDHSLHCGSALESLIGKSEPDEKNENIFITTDQVLNSLAFQASFSKVRSSISRIITVSRTGELQVFDCRKGKLSVISSAKLDLDEILFKHEEHATRHKADIGFPAFLLTNPSPLLFPQIRIPAIIENAIELPDQRLVFINENQQLLLVKNRHEGARELLSYIPPGNYAFAVSENKLSVLVSNLSTETLILYKVDLESQKYSTLDLHGRLAHVRRIAYTKRVFILEAAAGIYEYSESEDRFEKTGKFFYDFPQPKKQEFLTGKFQSYVKNDNIVINVRGIHLNEQKQLCFGAHVIVQSGSFLKISNVREIKGGHCFSDNDSEDYYLLTEKNIRFRRCCWKDGSEAIVDSRGFLHLRSSSKMLCEITIALVLNKTTAAWSSDGNFCGSTYFFLGKDAMPVQSFYKKYIQAFIDQLQ